jgi:hypothetical protein
MTAHRRAATVLLKLRCPILLGIVAEAVATLRNNEKLCAPTQWPWKEIEITNGAAKISS